MKDFLERVRYKTIILEEDERGRAAGQVRIELMQRFQPFAFFYWQCWVELESRDEMERALDLHRKHLGSRFRHTVPLMLIWITVLPYNNLYF